MRQLSTGLALLILISGLLVSTADAAWKEPSHWSKIGTVQQWMDLDARFYRAFDDNRFVDRSQFKIDQQTQYAKTKLYGGDLPAVSIQEYLALSEEDRKNRSKQAANQLLYPERFLKRVQDQVQKVRENLPSGWGDQISDVTVIGDCLINIGNAIGLDPSNPYAWHLQSYLAMCAGDETRSRQYLEGAVQALSLVPEDALTEMKVRVALDLAWNQRNLGQFDQALASVELAENLSGPQLETRLLGGLIFAQTGRAQDAGEIAASLRSTEMRQFPTNLRTVDFRPELQDPASWAKVKSNYLAAWITSLSLLAEGNRELAYSTFGTFSMDNMYEFGWRFWNEAGLIYEMTGRSAEALKAWNTARINRPWLRNMVYKPYSMALGVLTGHDDEVPYLLGYDRHFITGSRLAYGASLVGKVGNAEAPVDKQEWALRALDELEICQKTGNYPGQASVLQGHVYYLLGDIKSTLAELGDALVYLEKQGDDKVHQAVLKDLNAIMQNQQAGDVAAFFKQAGNSRGRWEADTDPQGRAQALQARLAADPTDRETVLEMARFMIRHDQPAEGKALVMDMEGNETSMEAVSLVLEADRLMGDTELALALVAKLQAGNAAPWDDSGVWSLVGSICHEQDLPVEARLALEHALDLDPANQGLRMQLRLMGD